MRLLISWRPGQGCLCPIWRCACADNSVLTDVTLRALGKACRELNHLYIAGCYRVSDQGMKAIANLKKLKVLNIADCTRWGSWGEGCEVGTEGKGEGAGGGCADGVWLSRISDTGVRYIIENSPGPQLRELNLTNLTKIGDVTLLRISQKWVLRPCHRVLWKTTPISPPPQLQVLDMP